MLALLRIASHTASCVCVCVVLCSTLDCRALVLGFDCDEDSALNFHEFVSMVELEYLPAGQSVQLDDPTPEYLPAAHAMQPVVAPDSE